MDLCLILWYKKANKIQLVSWRRDFRVKKLEPSRDNSFSNCYREGFFLSFVASP